MVALVFIHFPDFRDIDTILGMAIAFYMVYSAYPIVKEGILMLMDIALDEDEIEKIQDYLLKVDDINGTHHLTTRRSGSDIFITVHVVFNISISLYDAHRISDKIEDGLQGLFEDERVHSIIHMDPYDDSDINDENL